MNLYTYNIYSHPLVSLDVVHNLVQVVEVLDVPEEGEPLPHLWAEVLEDVKALGATTCISGRTLDPIGEMKYQID